MGRKVDSRDGSMREEDHNIDELVDNLQNVQQEMMDKISELKDMCSKISTRSEDSIN